jgi:hypothetical protein
MRTLYVPRLRVGLPDAKPQREFAVELGVGQKKIAARVQPVHQKLIGLILIGTIARNRKQTRLRGGRGDLEALIIAHPARELLRQAHVLANVMLQAFDAVMPDHKPELE